MATITIKDLTESIDLDRHAMQAITGGSRTSGRRTPFESTLFQSTRIVSYPAGLTRTIAMGKHTLLK